MSVIGRLLDRGTTRSAEPISDWSARRLQARRGTGPAIVDTNTALAHSAVWACSTLIADVIATFPWAAYRKNGDVRTELDADIVDAPSAVVTPIVWRTQALMSLLLRGNVFGVVTKWRGTTPTKLELVSPDDVSWTKRADGAEEWRLRGAPIELWPFGPLWHMPAYVLPGQRLGLSVLSYAAAAISLGHEAENFGRDWFTDGAHPSGLLKHDGNLSEEDAEKAKKRWMDKVHGSREPVVLGASWSYDPIHIQEKDSQFLETIQANVADVARFFRVQPELIGASSGNASSITYANVEHRSISLLQFTFGPWTYRLEEALTHLLPRPQYVKANVDSFLRTDALSRSLILDRQLKNGMRNLDEARALEDLPPVPEIGQQHVWPPLPAPQPADPASQEDPNAA